MGDEIKLRIMFGVNIMLMKFKIMNKYLIN